MATASYLIPCPSCGAVNRTPVDKEGLRGHCGSCKAILPALYCHPQQVNDRTFDTMINSYPGPVLAEFWSPT
jgi:thioredoxin 2